MLGEREFFIRKALGWVLRETSKLRPELSYRFLAKNRDRVSGLTLREGAKHLPQKMRASLGLAKKAQRRRAPSD
jgi:3-methyladenine DNA glycosylase AlkD